MMYLGEENGLHYVLSTVSSMLTRAATTGSECAAS